MGFMTFCIGHSPEVRENFINSRIRNMVKKKRIRSAKADLLPSHIVLNKLSLSVTELTHWTASVAVVPFAGALIVTPLSSIVDFPIIMFCTLTTRIRISDIIAMKITGLNTRSINHAALRYLASLPCLATDSSLLNTLNKTMNGDAIINIQRKATLIMLAMRSNKRATVYISKTTVLSEKLITVTSVVFCESTVI